MKFLKKILFITGVSLLFITQNIYAESQQFTKKDNNNNQQINFDLISALNKINEQDVNDSNEQYEHPLRRFEITFFITAPFTFIFSFLSISAYDTIVDSYKKKRFDGNVNVWKDYKIPLLTGTIGLSAAIASREAWICMKMNKERDKESGNNGNIRVSIAKYF